MLLKKGSTGEDVKKLFFGIIMRSYELVVFNAMLIYE